MARLVVHNISYGAFASYFKGLTLDLTRPVKKNNTGLEYTGGYENCRQQIQKLVLRSKRRKRQKGGHNPRSGSRAWLASVAI